MSKPVFSDLFKFEGRRNRLSYLLIQLSTWAATVAGILLAAVGLGMFDGGGGAAVGGSALIFVGGATTIGAIIAAWITSARNRAQKPWKDRSLR